MSQLQRMILMLLAAGVMALTCTRASTAEDQSAYSNVVLPDQGWTDDDRLRIIIPPRVQRRCHTTSS